MAFGGKGNGDIVPRNFCRDLAVTYGCQHVMDVLSITTMFVQFAYWVCQGSNDLASSVGVTFLRGEWHGCWSCYFACGSNLKLFFCCLNFRWTWTTCFVWVCFWVFCLYMAPMHFFLFRCVVTTCILHWFTLINLLFHKEKKSFHVDTTSFKIFNVISIELVEFCLFSLQ